MSLSRSLTASVLLTLVTLAACGGSTVPARLETFEGRQVEVATAGTDGAATVVFEAGLTQDWTGWDEVASEVAEHARVFAYSRPGYGASDPVTHSRDPQLIVEELRRLLASQGYAPPYVLVGHSTGGGYAELFAKSHSAEVAGVVLVDSRHRDFLVTCEAAELDLCGNTESDLEKQSPTVVAEYRAFAMMPDEIRAAGAFGSYPVRVLTAGDTAGSAARVSLWKQLHAELAAEATDGQHIIVEGAGHAIQLDRPDVVVESILNAL